MANDPVGAAFAARFGLYLLFPYKVVRWRSAEKAMSADIPRNDEGVRQKGVGMSLSGAHRAAFRREVTQVGQVFAIRDPEGFPAPAGDDGRRAVAFLSNPTPCLLKKS
jgi:hypothetical protein